MSGDQAAGTVDYVLVFLAAGYGTRLKQDVEKAVNAGDARYARLLDLPKALLPIGPDSRPLIEHWLGGLERLEREPGPGGLKVRVTHSYVVTNHYFAPHFSCWLSQAATKRGRGAVDTSKVRIIDNKTMCNEERHGAIGDLDFALEYCRLDKCGPNTRYLVMASDLLFDENFDFCRFLREEAAGSVSGGGAAKDGKFHASLLHYSVPDADVSKRGILEKEGERVVGLVEKPKPSETASRLACPAFYVFDSQLLELTEKFLKLHPSLEQRDAPGRLLQWIFENKEMADYRVRGWPVSRRFDVGNLPQYIEADDYFRATGVSEMSDFSASPTASPRDGDASSPKGMGSLMSFAARRVIQEECYARVALCGNPSDGFGGKTISSLVKNFKATVTITERFPEHGEEQGVVLLPHLKHDSSVYSGGLEQLAEEVKARGYYGGIRLLTATCKKFYELVCDPGNSDEKCLKSNFTVKYSTTIPQSVGLSGSSAIIVATFKGLLRYHFGQDLSVGLARVAAGVRRCYPFGGDDEGVVARNIDDIMPQVILDIEKEELRISAGLQDRVIQWFGGMVYMNFADELVKPPGKGGRGWGDYRPLVAGHGDRGPKIHPVLGRALRDQLFLAYSTKPGGCSGGMHQPMHERFANKEPVVIEGMQQLAANTEEFYHLLTDPVPAESSVEAVATERTARLAELMEANFAIRCRMYGAAISPEMLAVAAVLGPRGLACKFTGSGGAFVCMRKAAAVPGQEDREWRAAISKELEPHKFKFVPIEFPFELGDK